MAFDDADLQARLDQLEADVNGPNSVNGGEPSPGSHSQAKTPTAAPWYMAIPIPLAIVAVPWVQEIIDQVLFGGQWNLVLHPRRLDGVPGIFLSAISHAGFGHLIANTVPFVIFSWLILLKSRRDYWIVLAIGWLGGGVVSWLLGPTSVHGLSGVVYTLLGYLLAIGWLEKRLGSLAISVFVALNFSAYLFGVLPSNPMVAWWGHLFGLVLGVFAAYGVYRE